MRNIIKKCILIALSGLLWQSCGDNGDEEDDQKQETITLHGIKFFNSCHFDATYEPYSKDSHRDQLHNKGQHVLCTINGKSYEVEFLEEGNVLTHFYGRFHILKEEGVEVSHEEDGVVWYHEGLSGSLISYWGKDTSFSVTYYEKSNVYGDNSVIIPKEVVNRAIESTKRTAFKVDSLRRVNIDDPNFPRPPYPQIRVKEQLIVEFSYNEEDGLYYTTVDNNQQHPLLPDKEIIAKNRLCLDW